ncbi:MAG: hypothetical protein ACRDQY_23890 [Pseudonocardiaceae bacterium]
MEIAGHDVINHVGAAALRIIADRMGLTSGLSWALARRGFVPVHDRGRVLVDTAVLIADGGRVLSDLAMLRDQGELFGPVASDSTLWRGLNEIGERERIRIAPGEGAQHSECTAGLIEPGADVARRWEAAPTSTRGEIARLLLTPELIGQLRLLRSPRRGGHRRTPARDRVEWWRG